VDVELSGGRTGDTGAHGEQQLPHGVYVVESGDVMELESAGDGECSGHSRESGIFAAADADGSAQRRTSDYFQPAGHSESLH